MCIQYACPIHKCRYWNKSVDLSKIIWSNFRKKEKKKKKKTSNSLRTQQKHKLEPSYYADIVNNKTRSLQSAVMKSKYLNLITLNCFPLEKF